MFNKNKGSYTILIVLLLCSTQVAAQYKITDTVYYNDKWQICEKPLAAYYRNGVLASLDNTWYYTGEIKDYTINNTILLEGTYSSDGIKEGDFKFYYPNRQVHAFGKYKAGKMSGEWKWYYQNGHEMALINFPDDSPDCSFIKFIDEQGQSTLENGTGDFLWYTNPFDTINTYVFTGSYKSGKKNGKWEFYAVSETGKKMKRFTEKYNKHGNFVEVLNDDYRYLTPFGPYDFRFSPAELRNPENMYYDDLFKINGDTSAYNNLIYYLVEHKPTEVNLKYKLFDVAFSTILKTLDRYKYRIRFNQQRDIDGKLEFMIGSKGFLENISFGGLGLDIKELSFFTFLLGKFKNIEMPGDDKVGVETNYTIYCYSLDFQEVIPGSIIAKNTKELIFSFKPREKAEQFLHDNRKEIKKEIKKH